MARLVFAIILSAGAIGSRRQTSDENCSISYLRCDGPAGRRLCGRTAHARTRRRSGTGWQGLRDADLHHERGQAAGSSGSVPRSHARVLQEVRHDQHRLLGAGRRADVADDARLHPGAPEPGGCQGQLGRSSARIPNGGRLPPRLRSMERSWPSRRNRCFSTPPTTHRSSSDRAASHSDSPTRDATRALCEMACSP